MSVCMFHKITGIFRCPNLVFICIRVYGCECVLAYLFLKFFFSFEIINQHDRRAKQSNERGAKKGFVRIFASLVERQQQDRTKTPNDAYMCLVALGME